MSASKEQFEDWMEAIATVIDERFPELGAVCSGDYQEVSIFGSWDQPVPDSGDDNG